MALVSLRDALHLRLRALLKVRQQRLGHSDLRLTRNVYTQIASEDDARVAAQLGELVTRNSLPKLSRDAIGIGGAVARSPLPHHPTCGSASGGSEGYAGLSSNEGSPSDAK
jgi:hypothetical protein